MPIIQKGNSFLWQPAWQDNIKNLLPLTISVLNVYTTFMFSANPSPKWHKITLTECVLVVCFALSPPGYLHEFSCNSPFLHLSSSPDLSSMNVYAGIRRESWLLWGSQISWKSELASQGKQRCWIWLYTPSPPATQWSWHLQMPTTGLTTWASTPCCGKCDNTGQVGHALPPTCSNMNDACFYAAISEPTKQSSSAMKNAWLHLGFDPVQDLTPHVGQTPLLWRLNCPPSLVGGWLPTVPTPLPERAKHWLLPFTCQKLDHFPPHKRARSQACHPWSQPTHQLLIDRNTLACSMALLQNKSIGSAHHCQLGIWHCMPCDCLLISPFDILGTYMLPLCWMAVPIPSGPWRWAKLGPIELSLHDKFIPAILGTDTPPDDDLWCLLYLRVKQGARWPCILWSHNTSHSPHPALMSGHRDISLLCPDEHSPQHMKSPSMHWCRRCHWPQSLSGKRKGSTNLIAQSNLKIQKYLEHPPSLTES